MDRQQHLSQIHNRAPRMTYFFQVKGRVEAMEEKEAAEYYKKHRKDYIGRTDGISYKDNSEKLRKRVRDALDKEPAREEEIKQNARRAVQKIFSWEAQKAKQDKTPPIERKLIATNARGSQLRRINELLNGY